MRRISIDLGTIWVCQCCMLDHANGECCPDADHGGDGIAPWSAIDSARFGVSMGLGTDEHDEECEVRITGGWPDNYECDCERHEFSTSQCEGCGSWLHGSRYAFGMTRERQRFPRVSLPA
jgi:hypothetical protein